MTNTKTFSMALGDGERLQIVVAHTGGEVGNGIDPDGLLARIAARGVDGLRRVALNRAYGTHGVAALDTALDALLERGEILLRVEKGPTGKPARIYVARACGAAEHATPRGAEDAGLIVDVGVVRAPAGSGGHVWDGGR